MATADNDGPGTDTVEDSNVKDSLDATVDMIELFDKTVAEHEATFVIYYRGNW